MSKAIYIVHTWLLIFLFPFYCISDEPYVACRLHGQLGNQLYQVATTLAYAWDYNVKPLFPELMTKTEYQIPENRDQMFSRLDGSPLPRSPQHSFTESIWHSSIRIPYRPDQYLYGHFQSWNHFHLHRDKLLEILAPTESQENYLHEKYKDLLAHPKTVAIHVRTFSAENHNSGCFPFLGMRYYQQAMDLFPEDTLFAVFSDRINWCKHHFGVLNKNIVFIEGNNHILDLFLMSKLKSQIIANSSYSWWGAYLNVNPEKIVVAPRFWMHPRINAFPPYGQPNFFLFDDTVIIDPDYHAPYPDDMKWYDERSQSVDNN